jgi:hypothetical protein
MGMGQANPGIREGKGMNKKPVHRFPPRLFAANIEGLCELELLREIVFQLAILNQTLLMMLDLMEVNKEKRE